MAMCKVKNWISICDIISLMKKFLGLRSTTLVWGFLVSWFFTGELIVAGKIFAAMAIGNTVIMYLWMRERRPIPQ